ncbi:hypothetical protein EGR_04489 [Echinococcus granulosus]|uniref:Uncharacterized protein n=1 Tax=Echinococcus granulosus TaxID=6210 RepID=W6UHW7_ECHGR|nr:hypothetical protein EGR_04489 [Echinococcus granulosus]EUB60656.1 hypothetical protein EGR_04489 [Echinococcus granulosus]
MVIVKRREEDGQLPLLILRRGYSQNSSALHQPGFNPNWWRVQLFSRNFQLPRSQKFDLVHQRLHSPYHYLFFNRAQSFHNPLDDFLSPPWRKYETQSTLVVRFCLNDNGFQMPDSGLAVFTTLLKAKLACSIRLPTSRNSHALYTRNSNFHGPQHAGVCLGHGCVCESFTVRGGWTGCQDGGDVVTARSVPRVCVRVRLQTVDGMREAQRGSLSDMDSANSLAIHQKVGLTCSMATSGKACGEYAAQESTMMFPLIRPFASLLRRDQETDSLVTFDRIVTSDSFVGPDKDLFYVGLFASTETSSPSQLFQQSLRLMGSPVALCIFRASDLSRMVTQAPLAVQMRNEPVRKLLETNRTVGGAVEESLRFLRLNGSAEQLDSLQGIVCIPSHRVARSQAQSKNQSSADEGLSLPEQCKQSDNHALIKGVYLQQPWMPADGGEAIALLQTKDRFVAMLVDTVKRSPVSPRRKLMQGREICVLYLLTETCQLIVFLVTKRGLFYEHELEDNVESVASNLKNLLISGGVEALFFIHFSPSFTSSHVQMEFASSGEVVISDRHRLAVVDMKACFAASFYDKEGVAIAKYLSIERDADAFATQVFRWRTVKFVCQLPYGRPRSSVTFPHSKGNIFTNGSVVTPSSSLSSPSSSSTEKTSLLLVVWILSVLFVGLSVACLLMVVALLRLKSTYAKQCHRLQDSNANSESLYHQNTHQGHEKFSDVINLSQTSVVMEPEYHFSSILPPESKENVVGPLDVLAVPEALPKIHTYTTATHILLNSPSLPRQTLLSAQERREVISLIHKSRRRVGVQSTEAEVTALVNTQLNYRLRRSYVISA